MALTEAEKQMILDLRKEINDLKRERVRLRVGIVTEIGPTVKVRLGGECGSQEIAVVTNGPVAEGDVVTVAEGGGGAVVTGQSLTGGSSGFDEGSGITIDGKEIAVDESVARKNLAAQLTGVGNPTEWNHGANKNYVDLVAALILGNIPEVASLPPSPFNGYTVLYNGWLCRFDSTPPVAAYPWAVLGGRDLVDQNEGDGAITSTSYVTPTGPVQITLPNIKGVFDIKIEGRAYLGSYGSANDPGWIEHSYRLGSTGADRVWGWEFGSNSPRNGDEMNGGGFKEWRHTINTAGVTITEQAKRFGGASGTHLLMDRSLRVRPVYIGT